MGNNPSSTAAKPAAASSVPTSSASSSHHDHNHGHSQGHSHGHGVSRSASKRDSKGIMAMHTTQRVAVPPEESLASATRSNVINHPKPLSQSVSGLSSSSSPTNNSSNSYSHSTNTTGFSTPQQQQQVKPSEAIPVSDVPSKPVDVPSEPSSARSHHHVAPVAEPLLVSQNSITDLSYLTRPPRLPLPIEEELHTPGSPILAATEAPELAEIEPLEADGFTRKSSALSSTSVDDEEDEEDGLVVDKTRPTVPTRLEWLRGGEKVYVTGTIFQWNRKHRLHPVYAQTIPYPPLPFPFLFLPFPC